MRFMVDENGSRLLVQLLQAAGADVTWAAQLMPGADDLTVLRAATSDARTLVTEDSDFGRIIFEDGEPAPFGIVRYRFGHPNDRVRLEALVAEVERVGDLSNRFLTMTDRGSRLRDITGSEDE